METKLPKPPVPAGVDLHDFSFTPIFRAQLFRSAFHARASDAEWRAAVTLWLKSWDQMPAGSLPDDDVELCRLAEFGRNQRSWKKVRRMALHGWFICDDLRLYHKVVAEGVIAAYARRMAASEKGKLGASKRWPVIQGGLFHSTGNGTGNTSAIAQAMPGDSNRQGEGDRDPTPTPPKGGAVHNRRSEARAEKDEATAAWYALLASQGVKRDARVQAAIEAIGGWTRIAQRKTGEEATLRSEFCNAYRNAEHP